MFFVVVQSLSCVWLHDPMDCSMPGFPVLHYLPELAQTHVHWISDAIQPSHVLSSPSPPAFNLSQHQGLFQWVISSHQGFPCGSAGKESSCNAGDLVSIPGLGRSPGEGKGYTLQYSGLENSMDCVGHGVAKNRTRLSDFHFTSQGSGKGHSLAV